MAAIDAFSELRPPLDTDAALLEADRCLFLAPPPYALLPCAAARPAGVDVPRFVRDLIQKPVDHDWAELADRCRVGDEKGASS